MCFPFLFGGSGSKKRKGSSSAGEKKRRERPPSDALRGEGAPVAEVEEKRRSTDRPRKTRSKESPRRERVEDRQQEYRDSSNVYRSRAQYRAPLNLDVPTMWHRAVSPESNNSSSEMLLNPRPQRSQHHRQRHPKQATLRGHGAKREKSKKDIRPQPSAWSFFSPASPPKTPRRRDRDHHHYKPLDSSSSPRSHRSPRSPRSHRSQTQHTHSDISDSPTRSQPRQHRSRQQQAPSSSVRTRQAAPNTSVRRVPDRRFAVLAATNTALEDLRREAFAQSTPPPPRRERLRRYQGVTIPAASIPYTWDCVSSSQNSAGYGEVSSQRPRRRR